MKLSIHHLLRLAAATGVAILLGAAGIAIGGGGATGTGFIAQGRISAFGSIFVNGIEFSTDKAAITVNGVPGRSQDDLRLGMVLDVDGAIDGNGRTGDAATVDYRADAIGRVEGTPAVTSDGVRFEVLGQTVYSDTGTVFDNLLGPYDVRAGDFVEVSGFRSPAGVLASRIARIASVATVQVQGTVANLGAAGFTLGALAVDDTAATFKNLPAGGLANGQAVVVKGPAPSAGVLRAQEVDVLASPLADGRNGSVSGLVAEAIPGAIVVNGQAIATASPTEYVDGSAADLAAGRFVKVDFTSIGGALYASRIEFVKVFNPSFVEADVTAVGTGFVEMLGPGGLRITADAATEYQDNSDARLRSMTLADIRAGDHLRVNGNRFSQDAVLATKIVRRRPEAAIALEGRVSSAAAPSFVVVGLPVTVTAATQLRDERGDVVSAAAFFAKVAGHDASVSASLQGGVLVATSVRLDY
jgi:hypothetical protein